jgi:hypothetical protein
VTFAGNNGVVIAKLNDDNIFSLMPPPDDAAYILLDPAKIGYLYVQAGYGRAHGTGTVARLRTLVFGNGR